jgi:ATP-binding cassette, subfamily B, bacterial
MQVSSLAYRRLLHTYLAPQTRRMALLAGLMLIDLVLQLALPRVVQGFIDGAIAGMALQALIWIGVAYLLVAITQNAALVGWQYVAQNIGMIATNRIRADLTLHCLKLDLAFLNQHTPGEMIERIDGDVTKLGNFLSQFIVQLVLNGLLLLAIIVLLMLVDWRIGLPTLVGVVVAILSAGLITKTLAAYSIRERQASAELFGLLEERLQGSEDIRANGAVGYVLRRHIERSRVLFHVSVMRAFYGMMSWRALETSVTIGAIISLVIAAGMALQGTLSIGQVYLVFAYTTMLNNPVEQLMRQLDDLQQAIAGISRVQQLFDTTSQLHEPPAGATLPHTAVTIEFDQLQFGYPGDELVLQQINATIPAGTTLGLIGRTGSGKTTLTRLLLRLYDPSAGVIRLGGMDLRSIPNAEIRRSIAIVTQDIQLFSATVRDNLTFFDSTISDQQLLRALTTLGLDEWLASLPHGLDTRLAAGGSGLSAGQAQLLAFARAYLRNPQVIILDEASSRLDPATERQLEHAVAALLHGRTGIIIAHRLGTLQRVDQIMLLEAGQIAEYGSREELVQNPDSRFSQLLRIGMEEALV